MKINNATLAIAAATLVAVLALVAWLTYANKDVTQLVTLVVTLLTVAGGSAVTTRKVSKVQAGLDAVAGAVDGVHVKVNGNLSTLIAKATENGHDVTPHVDLIDATTAAIERAADTPA